LDAATAFKLGYALSTLQDARQPRVSEIIAEANKLGDGKRDLSVTGIFIKKWDIKIFVTFLMKETWLGG
jgi:hypothetical protein